MGVWLGLIHGLLPERMERALTAVAITWLVFCPSSTSAATVLNSGQKLAITPCDCGVLWENLGTVQSISNIGNTGSYYGYGVNLLSWTSTETNSTTVYLPVANVDQAMHRCYHRIDCHGFVYYLGVSTGQPYRAYFYDYTRVASQTFAVNSVLATLNTGLSQVYNLTRSELYRCPSLDLDYYYYYFSDATRRAEIEQAFCVNPLPDLSCCWNTINGVGVAPCHNLNPLSTSSDLNIDSTWRTTADMHWRFYGNKLRYPPSDACVLTPTLWDSVSKCASPTSGCYAFDSVPCGKRGYCTENSGALASPWYRDPDNAFVASAPLYTTLNYCSCANYTNGNFDDAPIYHGRSCAVRSFEVCAQPGNFASMCSGANVNCLPRKLSLTPPDLDYTAQCYCDADPPWQGSGTYCEIGRCVPGGGACGLDGSCSRTSTSPDVWSCQCGLTTVGAYCQFSSAGCRSVDSSVKCKGRGTCYPPSLPPDNATYSNFNTHDSWCACPESSFFGSNCQFERCDASENVSPGHGRCSDTGLFVSCYAPYTSSNSPLARCDIDRCNNTGGVVVQGFVANPPSNALELVPTDCGCGKFLHGTSGDITCYPRCGNGTNGVLCGASTSLCNGVPQIPICTRTSSGNSRFAECVCGPGLISVAAPTSTNTLSAIIPPVGKNKTVCESWCVHGCVTLSWVFPQPCNCLPNLLGYDVGPDEHGVSYPRCDHRTCAHGGVWQSGSQQCACVGPYTLGSKCVQTTCDDPATTSYVEGVVIPDPLHPSTDEICQCNGPFRASSSSLQDCSVSTCGGHGFPNPSITNITQPAGMCTCTGGFITICNDFSGTTCAFCASMGCQNGGALHIQDNVNVCACPFPWQGDSFCFTSLCGTRAISLSGLCACTDGFTGPLCLTSPCVHGNWSESLSKCLCATGWNGTHCTTSSFLPEPPPQSHTSSSSSSSSTGGAHSSSSSAGTLGNSSSSSSSTSDSSNDTLANSGGSAAASGLSTPIVVGIAVGVCAFTAGTVLLILKLAGVIWVKPVAVPTTAAAVAAAEVHTRLLSPAAPVAPMKGFDDPVTTTTARGKRNARRHNRKRHVV